jgi:hypothetical protein
MKIPPASLGTQRSMLDFFSILHVCGEFQLLGSRNLSSAGTGFFRVWSPADPKITMAAGSVDGVDIEVAIS